jgi:4-diphosphocytidyl-2-C-methyl-D-erythritol kinase
VNERRESGEEAVPPGREVLARAKINLFLRVVGLRADGYHDLETAILPIDLADRLWIHADADGAQHRRLSLSLEVTGDRDVVAAVPSDHSNLVIRAAQELAARTGVHGFAHIRLEKRIPSAAGLGGGSSDAASTLVALNELWGCGLDDPALREVGAVVGSDVPALMAGGPVLVRGRGERVEPLAMKYGLSWVLVPFDFGVSTAEAFRWWDEDGGSTGPDARPIVLAASSMALGGRQGDLSVLAGLLYNDLEEPVMRRHPPVGQARGRLLQAGAPAVVMCGSGPTLAGLLPSGDRHEPIDAGLAQELANISGRPIREVFTDQNPMYDQA